MPISSDVLNASLSANVGRVRAAIAESCRRAGRESAEVRLVAVTKYVRAELIDALRSAGVCDIAESRVQQLVQRAARVGEPPAGFDAARGEDGLVWHMIGHLQRNKVKPLIPHVSVIHSIDSLRLGEEIQKRAAAIGASVDIFVEVNVAGETSKSGLAYDETAELAESLEAMPNLRVCGLMTMAARASDPEAARPCFARLRELLESMRGGGAVSQTCRHLSMGMSGDYGVAVEEGATVVRIGSALYEGLHEFDLRQGRAG